MVMQATYKQATSKQATSKQATQKWAQPLWSGLTYLLVFLLVFPVLWMVITGFKTEAAAYSPTPTLILTSSRLPPRCRRCDPRDRIE